jgi:hypothetical protein
MSRLHIETPEAFHGQPSAAPDLRGLAARHVEPERVVDWQRKATDLSELLLPRWMRSTGCGCAPRRQRASVTNGKPTGPPHASRPRALPSVRSCCQAAHEPRLPDVPP